MNKITKTNLGSLILLCTLFIATMSSCTDAKTSSDATSSVSSTGQMAQTSNDKATQDDAQSATRKKQLEADIRAREQRNNAAGNPAKRNESDLASEVRSKLEANIPQGKLIVNAKNMEITVSGVVKTQEQLNKIKALAMEIKGVSSVVVKAIVKP